MRGDKPRRPRATVEDRTIANNLAAVRLEAKSDTAAIDARVDTIDTYGITGRFTEFDTRLAALENPPP